MGGFGFGYGMGMRRRLGPAGPPFTVQPSISPGSGDTNTVFTATDGTATGAVSYTRRWLLDGVAIGTGTTVTPAAAGSLVLEVTATNGGGQSTIATSAAVTVTLATGLVFFTTPLLGTGTLSNSDKTLATTASDATFRAMTAITGKKVFAARADVVSSSFAAIGIGVATATATMGGDGARSAAMNRLGDITFNGSTVGGVGFVSGNTVGVVVDYSAGKLWFTIDGTSFRDGATRTAADVAAGTGGISIAAMKALGTIYPLAGSNGASGSTWTLQATYPWSPPSGFSQL